MGFLSSLIDNTQTRLDKAIGRSFTALNIAWTLLCAVGLAVAYSQNGFDVVGKSLGIWISGLVVFTYLSESVAAIARVVRYIYFSIWPPPET